MKKKVVTLFFTVQKKVYKFPLPLPQKNKGGCKNAYRTDRY